METFKRKLRKQMGRQLRNMLVTQMGTCVRTPSTHSRYGVLWNNPSAHSEYVSFSLVNKEADWPITKQDKLKQDNQTGDTGIKKGGVRKDASQLLRKQSE